jgi:hypothetical protein
MASWHLGGISCCYQTQNLAHPMNRAWAEATFLGDLTNVILGGDEKQFGVPGAKKGALETGGQRSAGYSEWEALVSSGSGCKTLEKGPWALLIAPST